MPTRMRRTAPGAAKSTDQREDHSSPRQRSFDERQAGRVKFFNPEKGWGFIEPDPGCVFPGEDADNDDIFVHVTEIPGTDLPDDERVEYLVEKTERGLKATDVELGG